MPTKKDKTITKEISLDSISILIPGTWDDGVYVWDDSQIAWNGSVIGQSNQHIINWLYAAKDSYLVLAPQLIKSRSRYRGYRESQKTNLEMQQTLFDIWKLYENTELTTVTLATNFNSLEFGTNMVGYFWSSYYPTMTYDTSVGYDTNEYDSPIFTSIPSIDLINLQLTGSTDIISRLDRLLKRVKALETNQIS